jgi:hypothetical protein
LSAELPLEQILLPFLATPTIGRSGLDRLAAALVAGIESIQPTPTAGRT